jgi:hypothetical protein
MRTAGGPIIATGSSAHSHAASASRSGRDAVHAPRICRMDSGDSEPRNRNRKSSAPPSDTRIGIRRKGSPAVTVAPHWSWRNVRAGSTEPKRGDSRAPRKAPSPEARSNTPMTWPKACGLALIIVPSVRIQIISRPRATNPDSA